MTVEELHNEAKDLLLDGLRYRCSPCAPPIKSYTKTTAGSNMVFYIDFTSKKYTLRYIREHYGKSSLQMLTRVEIPQGWIRKLFKLPQLYREIILYNDGVWLYTGTTVEHFKVVVFKLRRSIRRSKEPVRTKVVTSQPDPDTEGGSV